MKKNKEKSDFLSFAKPILVVCLALVMLAGAMVAFYGFNAGVDFRGGNQLVVDFSLTTNVDIENDEDLAQATNVVKDILQTNGVTVNSFQVMSEFGTKSFVVTFERVSQLTMQTIRVAINEQFNETEEFLLLESEANAVDILGNNFDLTRKSSVIESFVKSDQFFSTLSALLFALTILMIYAFFRLKFAGGTAVFFTGVFDVVMTLAFLALVRVQISSYIFVLMGVVLAVSVYMSADFALDIKDKLRDKRFEDQPMRNLANLVAQEKWKKNFSLAICAFVGLIILAFITLGSVMYVALAALVGATVMLASHTFIMPAFYLFFSKNQTNRAVATKQKEEQKATESQEK